MDRDDHFFYGDFHLFGYGFHDPHIGLMRDKPVDLPGGNPIASQDLPNGIAHGTNRMLEYFISLHFEVMEAGINHFMGGRMEGSPSGHIKQSPEVPIGVDLSGQDFSFFSAFGIPQDHGPGPITKKDASAPILIINPGGNDFRSDDQCVLMRAVLHKLLGYRQPIDKPRTSGTDIEGYRFFCPQTMLKETTGGGRRHIGCGGPDNNQIQILGREAGHFQGLLTGRYGNIGQGLSGKDHPPFLDAGTADDPIIRGIQNFFKIGIGNDAFR